MPEPLPDAPGQTETTRLEAFCDGVFAIAITLLVLEIRVPEPEAAHRAGGLLRALGGLWPSFVGYAIGFLTIGIMWANHHAIFQCVRRSDRYFLLINVAFLMLISFLPFPTAVLAGYLDADFGERRTAVALYGATVLAIALAYNALWWYAVRGGRLLAAEADPVAVRTISRRYAVGPLAYGIVFALAFAAPWASLAGHVVLAALYLLPERPLDAAPG
jgi:uncharacterized membrane protein